MRCFLRAASIVLVVAASAGALQAQTTLRFKFQKGDKLAYVMEQKMKSTATVMDKDITSTMAQSADLLWEVVSVDDKGNARMSMKFGKARMEIESPMGKVVLNSDDANEPNDPAGKAIFPMVKLLGSLEFEFTMTPRGLISDSKIPDRFLAELKKLGGMFDEEALKQMAGGGSAVTFPEGAVDKGKSWNNKNVLKLPVGKFEADFKFTYEGPAGKLEKIGVVPSLTLQVDPKAEVAIKLNSTKGGGEVLFDNAAGRIASMTTNQVIEISAEQNGVAITQKMDQTVTLKLKGK